MLNDNCDVLNGRDMVEAMPWGEQDDTGLLCWFLFFYHQSKIHGLGPVASWRQSDKVLPVRF